MLQVPAEKLPGLQMSETEHPDYAAGNQMTMGTEGDDELIPDKEMPSLEQRAGSKTCWGIRSSEPCNRVTGFKRP